MQYNIEEVCAVILTGGKSSRMGGGVKSLKKFNEITIFDRIYKITKQQIKNIIINTNSEEKNIEKPKIEIAVSDKVKEEVVAKNDKIVKLESESTAIDAGKTEDESKK